MNYGLVIISHRILYYLCRNRQYQCGNIMDTREQHLKNTHHGHAVKRFRQTLGMKQETLAAELGISQSLISLYEGKAVIEDEMIEKFARALDVAPAFIKELEEDPVTVIIENNTFSCYEGGIGNLIGENITYNNSDPVERIIELDKEKTALYERMLALEREKNALYEKLLNEKK